MHKLETKLAQLGNRSETATGAVNPPVYFSTAYRHEGIGETSGYDYSRTKNPTRELLEKAIADLEGGTQGFACSSGMAAIYTVLSLFQSGDELIVSQDLYGGTYRLFEKGFRKWGLKPIYVNTRDTKAIEAAITLETKAIFLETPTNPLMEETDIGAVAKIAKEKGLLLIVDNTFYTPLLQQPLKEGADIVVHSATKYLSGHNDVLAGLIVAKDEALAEEIFLHHNGAGGVLGPFDSWLVLRGMKTLALRMKKHEENAKALAEHLAGHPFVADVLYPKKGGMLSFRVKDSAVIDGFLRQLKLITFAESLGGTESFITYPETQTHGDIPKEDRLERGVCDRLLRFSVGIEDAEDLIRDFDQAFSNTRSKIAKIKGEIQMTKRFEIVGSFLRPEALLKFKREIERRDDIQFPFYSDLEGYEATETKAIQNIVNEQIEAGIPVISDGEYSKSLWHLDFVWGLGGVRRFIADKGYIFRDHGEGDDCCGTGFETRKDVGIEVVAPLSGQGHHHINVFKKIEAFAGGIPTKLCIPSPAHIYGEFLWSPYITADKVYANNEELKAGLINAYKEFVTEFAAAGGKIIQADDCLWEVFSSDNEASPFAGKKPADAYKVAEEFIQLNNQFIDHAKGLGLKVWTHNCRGNYKSRSMADGSYESIADLFLKGQKYDRFYLEWDDDRAGSLKALEVFKDTDQEIVLGLLSSKTGELDDEKRVLELLEQAAQIVDKDRLYLSHQCGFASCDNGNELTTEQQWEKIAQGQRLAKQFWELETAPAIELEVAGKETSKAAPHLKRSLI